MAGKHLDEMIIEKSNLSIGQRISEFRLCYKEAVKGWLFYSGLPEDFDKIMDEPLLTTCYFAAMAHERAGRNPSFPKFHRIAIRSALGGKDFEDALLNDPE